MSDTSEGTVSSGVPSATSVGGAPPGHDGVPALTAFSEAEEALDTLLPCPPRGVAMNLRLDALASTVSAPGARELPFKE